MPYERESSDFRRDYRLTTRFYRPATIDSIRGHDGQDVVVVRPAARTRRETFPGSERRPLHGCAGGMCRRSRRQLRAWWRRAAGTTPTRADATDMKIRSASTLTRFLVPAGNSSPLRDRRARAGARSPARNVNGVGSIGRVTEPQEDEADARSGTETGTSTRPPARGGCSHGSSDPREGIVTPGGVASWRAHQATGAG